MRIYLDTSIIHGWFRKYMEAKRKSILFEEPSILKFVFQLKDNDYVVSSITRAEIIRYLGAEWGAPLKECEEVWLEFMRFYDTEYLEVKRIDFDEIGEVCMAVKTRKKTMVNLLHIQVAKKEGLWFLTGEKELAEKYKGYYDKILTYEDLRAKFSR
jgi:predicted nucleic acid-binding protein